MAWTITGSNYSGVDVATIGISGLRYTLQNGLKDTCSFFMPVDEADSTSPPFAEKDSFQLAYSGTVQFRGYVDRCSPAVSGTQEGWTVEIAGLGQLLDICPYTQTLPITGSSTAEFSAGLVLGYNSSGTRLNLADTLTDIISGTSSRHGITAGTFLSGVTVTAPLMEVTDVTVGEAFRRAAAWAPDAVIYLDHSAGTLQMKKPAALTTVTRAGDANTVENNRDGRRRKAVDGVKIIWRKTVTVDENVEIDVTTDSAGTTTGPWTTIITIDLAGSNTVTQSEQCITDDLPEAIGDVTAAFLIEHWPELGAATPVAGQLIVHAVTQDIDADTHQGLGSLPSTYPRYLKAGNVPPWQSGISAATVKLTITLRAGADFADNPALVKLFSGDEKLLKLTKTFTGTDAQSITYTQLVAYEAGDSPVTGLASAWLSALNTAAPAGTLRLVDDEPILTVKPGTKLTLTGDLSVTDGVVQAVTVDVDTGETFVTYGPQSRLTPQEFVELQRAGSRRSPLTAAPGTVRTSASPTTRTVKGGISAKADSTAHKPQDNSGWFRIRQTGETTVRVGFGVLQTMEVSGATFNSEDPMTEIVKFAKTVFVNAGTVDLEPTSGDYIWLPVYLVYRFCVYIPTYYGAGFSVDGGHIDLVYAASANTNECVCSPTQPADGLDGDSRPASTYVCLGKVTISDDVMTIQQGIWGPVVVPPLFLVAADPPPS